MLTYQQILREKKYNPSKSILKSAMKSISKRLDVDEKFLKFIGAEDNGDLGILIYFNILDKNHIKYKSTVAELIKGD